MPASTTRCARTRCSPPASCRPARWSWWPTTRRSRPCWEPSVTDRPARDSAVRVALLYPELLGTYGDRGNARVLVQRLAWRGVPVELVEAPWGVPAPASCDIYVLGGGEDSPQASAAAALISEGAV